MSTAMASPSALISHMSWGELPCLCVYFYKTESVGEVELRQSVKIEWADPEKAKKTVSFQRSICYFYVYSTSSLNKYIFNSSLPRVKLGVELLVPQAQDCSLPNTGVHVP